MRVTDKMVERAAKALYEYHYRGWKQLGDMYKDAYRRRARKALKAALRGE